MWPEQGSCAAKQKQDHFHLIKSVSSSNKNQQSNQAISSDNTISASLVFILLKQPNVPM